MFKKRFNGLATKNYCGNDNTVSFKRKRFCEMGRSIISLYVWQWKELEVEKSDNGDES